MAFVNWNELDTPGEFITFFTAVGFVVTGCIGWVTGRYNRSTITNLKESNASLISKVDSLTEETKLCQSQHHDTIEKMGRLAGQVDAYKELFANVTSGNLEDSLDGGKKITKTTTVEKK